MAEGRIIVGEPLRGFRGVLSGIPEKISAMRDEKVAEELRDRIPATLGDRLPESRA
jgi:hypothetical protein